MDVQADHPAFRGAAAQERGGSDTAQSAQLRPAELVRALRRNALPIGACAVIGAVAAYAYAASLPKSYTAYGAVAVEGDRLAIPELQGVLRTDSSPDPMPFVRTEVQALQSRQLLVQVVQQLHLDRDPEFNAALRPPTLMGEITGRVKSVLPHGAGGAAGNTTNDAVVNAASHALAITQDNRSLVIGISFTAHDPRLAAAAVNDLVADYTAERENRRRAADHGANTAISARAEQVRKEIEQIEARMQALRTQSGLVSLRAGSVGQQQTEDLATAAAKATEQRSEIEANLARAQAAVLGSETISRLREQEAEASAKVADLSARFGPEYPALRSAQADLSAIRREVSGEAHRIVASLASQLQVARAHEADVQAQLAKADQEGVKAQDVQAQLQQLEQDATTRRALYSTLLEREQQTVAQPHNDEMAEVRVLSAATVPGLPSAPNMKLSAGLGGLAGAMFAGLVAVARGLSHARFNGDADIQSATGATVLARLRGRGGKARWARLLSGTGTLETEDAAALRGANIRLRAGGRSGSARVVAVTGAQSGLAASGIAAALARNVAHEGEPALLIETVARQGAVAWFAGDAAGADWRDAVLHEPGSQLDILSGAGPVDADMSAKRVALENLLVEAREDYNLIVFAAPMASEPGALAIARAADTTVLVVDETAADPAATREAAKRLAGMSRARLGAIVVGAA